MQKENQELRDFVRSNISGSGPWFQQWNAVRSIEFLKNYSPVLFVIMILLVAAFCGSYSHVNDLNNEIQRLKQDLANKEIFTAKLEASSKTFEIETNRLIGKLSTNLTDKESFIAELNSSTASSKTFQIETNRLIEQLKEENKELRNQIRDDISAQEWKAIWPTIQLMISVRKICDCVIVLAISKPQLCRKVLLVYNYCYFFRICSDEEFIV